MQIKTILSVDWDYFFPDISGFDWQMTEKKQFYYESAWHFRWGNINLFNPKIKAKKTVHPNYKLLKNFWGNIFNLSCLYNRETFIAYIVDSHSDIAHLIDRNENNFIVYNFDQHHDVFYDNQVKLDCDNWVHMLQSKINEYHLYYPSWRKEKPEGNIDEVKEHITSINYELPNQLIDADYVFICRSSCWTPSWSDKQWLNFIFPFERSYKSVITDYVAKKRPFDYKAANEFERITKKQMEELNNEVK